MNRKTFSFLGVVFVFLSMLVVHAQPPTARVLPFTGYLAGQPDGPVDLRLRLFPVNKQGDFCFQETQTVEVVAETFVALIGAGTAGGLPPSPCFTAHPSLWIAFALNNTPDQEMGSRQPIYSSGYAHFAPAAGRADLAGRAEGLAAGALAEGDVVINGLVTVAGAITTSTQYNIGGDRVMSVPGNSSRTASRATPWCRTAIDYTPAF